MQNVELTDINKPATTGLRSCGAKGLIITQPLYRPSVYVDLSYALPKKMSYLRGYQTRLTQYVAKLNFIVN